MEEQKSAKAGCFVPVDPQFALDYHGKYLFYRRDPDQGNRGTGVNGGLIGCVTGNKKLEFPGFYFVGNIDRRLERRKNRTAVRRRSAGTGWEIPGSWPGNRSMPAVKSGSSAGRGSPCLISYLPETETMRIKRSSFSARLIVELLPI